MRTNGTGQMDKNGNSSREKTRTLNLYQLWYLNSSLAKCWIHSNSTNFQFIDRQAPCR
jgi:hypothetical protein